MLIPLLIGAGVVALMVAASKKKPETADVPQLLPSSVWTFVFGSQPMMAAGDIGAVSVSLSAVMQKTGGTVESGSSPNPNTIVITVRLTQPAFPMKQGESINVGPYKMTLKSVTQAPSY